MTTKIALNNSLITLILCTTLALSCSKKDVLKTPILATENAHLEKSKSSTYGSPAPEQLTLSNYGFLVFANYEVFEDFLDFLDNSTHAEVQEYLHSIDFTCDGMEKYGEEYASSRLDKEQNMDYILNNDQIVQIDGVIFRTLEEFRYILTILPEYLNNENYERIKIGEFNREAMNRIATVRPEDDNFDLFSFIRETPFSYDEIDSEPPYGNMPEHPAWGFGKRCSSGVKYLFNAYTGEYDIAAPWEYCCRHTFWIRHSCGYTKQ